MSITMSERESYTQLAEDLDRAADYIDAHGWCQNHLTDDQGRVCAEGAMIGAVATTQNALETTSSGAIVTSVLDFCIRGLPDDVSRRMNRQVVAFEHFLRTTVDVQGAEIHYRDSWRMFEWNDRAGRTKDEVTDALRRCAKQVREELGAA